MDLEVNTKDLEVQSHEEAFEANLIHDIDAKGHLIVDSASDVETKKTNDVDMDFGFEKEEGNLIFGSGSNVETEKTNDVDMDFGFEKEEGNLIIDSSSDVEIEKTNDVDMDFGFEKTKGNVMGNTFNTLNDAYNFYNRYAFLHGFGIRIRQTFKNQITNEPYRRKFVCNKQGFKDLKCNSSTRDVKKRRRDLRTGCEAFLRISVRKDGKWIVDAFSDSHNHELTLTPTKVVKHRSHGKFHRSLTCKALMSELGQSGLKPCDIKKVVNTMKSSYENDVTSKQCSHILAEQRKQYIGKEFYGLIKHFQDKSIKDPNLYFVVDLFRDGPPRNIFWANGRSRDSYIKFGDVVVFDVTYMTNKFMMPFAPFVGVNHHGQSILFGGALLKNEKKATFEWLFQKILKCMFGKPPSAIITDQHKAICNAIKIVFPESCHRYCSWHIKKHEIEHLRPLKVRYSDFEELYKQYVKRNTVEEFETRWEILCGKCDFQSGSWITEMYNQRKYWAKAFIKDCFFAGMTSSGRSESIHSFFDGYVNSKTMLNEFVIQYDKAVEARRAAEDDEDFKTMNSKPILSSVNMIEAKASSRYTRKLFDAFKKEWIEATFNLTHETVSKSSEEIKCKVGQLDIDKTYWRNVNFRLSNKIDVTCSCAKFETYGVLCKHILYVLKKRHVETLPEHYILPKWTLDARHKLDNCTIGLEDIHDGNGVSELTLWCVQSNFRKTIEQARDSRSEIKKLNTILLKFLEEQISRTKSKHVDIDSQDSNVGSSQVNMMPQISVRDPLVRTNTKGRPKSATRVKSSLEAPKK